ncbi:putative viral structural protein [Sulfolobales Beppu filamentous virus 2]|uniref:Putative viral structural protein n=1 Tax=Sulfolobales Beppu filamentous virus 2 TaxID=2493123 RepID=A0A3S8NEW4_9VIRU|nr:putative viral structural protein [Sulfolobales Beppu filamentous virus 2]AZI75806.1 putative viral structural protein [Sulfolobales Beppu filamentous virus 2]
MMDASDLEAVLEDLEDICARIPENFHLEYRFTIPTPEMRELVLYFDCHQHKYYFATLEKGTATKTRVVSREEFLRRYERYVSSQQGSEEGSGFIEFP